MKIHSVAATLLVSALAFNGACAGRSPVGMAASRVVNRISNAATEEKLREAHNSFYAALNAMFTGDVEPMNAIWSHEENVSNMGPFDNRQVGWKAVGAEFKKEAAMKLGGTVICDDVKVFLFKDWGYTIGIERGANMTADGKPVEVRFRATNIFVLESGDWKIAHHHTDLSASLMDAEKKK